MSVASLSGNVNIQPASAEEIEKAIAAAQVKISQVSLVLDCLAFCFGVTHVIMLLASRGHVTDDVT